MLSGYMATSFCMMVLTLHKIVLYAPNHGYVHPNETDYEPCHLAGFLLFTFVDSFLFSM